MVGELVFFKATVCLDTGEVDLMLVCSASEEFQALFHGYEVEQQHDSSGKM